MRAGSALDVAANGAVALDQPAVPFGVGGPLAPSGAGGAGQLVAADGVGRSPVDPRGAGGDLQPSAAMRPRSALSSSREGASGSRPASSVTAAAVPHRPHRPHCGMSTIRNECLIPLWSDGPQAPFLAGILASGSPICEWWLRGIQEPTGYRTVSPGRRYARPVPTSGANRSVQLT